MSTLARAEGKRGNDELVKPLLREALRLLVQQGNFIYLIGPLVALGFMAMHSQEQPEGACSAAKIFGMMATWAEKVGGTDHRSRLSPRELDVLRLLARGLTSVQIAKQ